MHATRILVADDDQAILRTCRKILEHAGYEVTTAANGDSALGLLKSSHYDLFLVDMLMPGLSGLETVSLARQTDPTLMILMLTAYATIQTAVEAVKRGVFDYLAKPFTADQLRSAVEQSLRQKDLLEEKFSLRNGLVNDLGFDKILGTSEAMQRLFGTLQKVVRTNANILIQGETGTGKDLLARTIHAHSFRRDKPFLAVDCAALPENLLESELFGHEKGAFTGADRLKRGQLELAQAGTLFLDEIGELSFALQAKLLRVLQEREFRRLGSERQILVDIRVISATSRDLRNEIVARKFCQEYQLTPPEVCSDVRKLFAGYEWPGNVRELQNVIQHAVLMAESKSIGLCDLPEYLQNGSRAELSFLQVRDKEAETVEKPFLEDLLRKHHGNISKAAAEAKLSRKTIYRLAKRFSFDLGQFR